MTNDHDTYRIYAEQCLIIAERAVSPDIRAAYLGLAKRWEQLAAAAEKLSTESGGRLHLDPYRSKIR
jgi:hypothetical protein